MAEFPLINRFRIARAMACLLVLAAAVALPAADSQDPESTDIEGQWLIEVRPGEDARAAAARMGAGYAGPLRGVEGFHRVKFFRPLASRGTAADWRSAMARRLGADTGIVSFEPEQLLVRYPRSFKPADPLFAEQWHLENVGQSGGVPAADLRLRPVWDLGLTGQGVTIAIVDEGVEYAHPDLFPNWLPGSGYDYNDDDSDPAPGDSFDRHGTAVAGISLAASNAIGGLGVAWRAKLVPLRLIAGAYESGEEAEALSYHNLGRNIDIYNNSWGPSDDAGVRYADSTSTLKSALAQNVQTGRNGLGNIYVWAAGNGGLNGDNSNYDGYNSLPYTISVGAVGDDDIKEGYSEPGANLLVVAPSGGILTTDLTGSWGYAPGDTFGGFNGTSAAAPMVSGVVALMLQQRPGLNWRDVQQVLARTAVPVDFSSRKWDLNGAGLWTSHDYGFGRVDAHAAVQLARDWTGLPQMQTVGGQQTRQLSLPYGTVRAGEIAIGTDFEVQFVRVTVRLSHSDWGDLRIELVSPAGTRSVLTEPHANANLTPPTSWTYLSTRHLGEPAAGTWRLEVSDQGTAGTGSWIDWSLQVLGHDLSNRSNRPPSGSDLVIQSTRYPVEIDTLAGMGDPDGDPLTLLSVQQPRTGTLLPIGGDRFSYTMGRTIDGTETFSALYGDGRGGVSRRLIRVLDPRPVARNDLFPLRSGQPVDLPVLANDLDPDGDAMRIVAVDGSFAGEAVIADGTRVRYTAPAGYAGVARIRYQLSDDSDGESAGWITVVSQPEPDVAVELDGEDDHLLLPPTPELSLMDDFTAEAWIYPESYGEYVTGFGRILDRDTFTFFLNGFDHLFYNDRSLVVYVILADGRAAAVNSAANVISLNSWQHVAVTYDSGNLSQPVRMYVNGREVAAGYPAAVSAGPPLGPVADNRGYPLYIGESDSGARAFKGRMTELRVWNRVLPPATILAQQGVRLTGAEAGLRLYLPLDRTLEPFAVSAGGFGGTVAINGARRIPRELPWAQLKNHYNLLDDSGSGWWEERTLGWIFGDRYPWVYLPALDWAYSGHGAGGGVYLLHPVNNNWGWLMTSPSLYPWFYRFSTGSWLWYQRESGAASWFFDYQLSGWVSARGTVPGS